MESRSYVGVAAIDIGTTFSTWAMSLRQEFPKDPCNVETSSCKTPTSLLVKPDGVTLSAFGYDAEDKYIELCENGKHKAYYFFKNFKMMLYFQRVSFSDNRFGFFTPHRIKRYIHH